ncbi:MAG TPA: serine/threonine-protein kinase, partial [Kofleriaceae bacterium]|nr:serine/threonine-protein kinase [Kofleriaceae bacterium]
MRVNAVEAPARGGTSTVYRAVLGATPCVMKVADVSAASIASLDREALVLSHLHAPLAPALVGRTRTDEGRAALALEPIDGVTLSQWRRDAALPRRLVVATRLCERVAGIHARGVVHGDLSGRNVLVTATDDVRVIDFGSARLLGVETRDGGRLATPAYLAPGSDGAPATFADDVYAMGVLLFELCTGRLPFTGAGRALRQAHELQRPPLPSREAAVSRAIDEVVARCLAKDASARFVDGAALQAAWTAGLGDVDRPPYAPGTGSNTADVAPVDHTAFAAPVDRSVHAALLGFRCGGDLGTALRVVEAQGGAVAHVAAEIVVAAWTRGAAPDRAAAAARRALAALGARDFAGTTATVRVDARGVVRGAAALELATRIA